MQVVGVVGVVGYLSFKNGQATVSDLASQLRDELTGRILQQIRATVERPYVINQINANSLLQGDINVATGKGEHQIWQQAKVFPSTNLIYCATEADGAFLGVGSSRDSSNDVNLHIQVANATTEGYFHYYDVDSSGKRSFLRSKGNAKFDPRARPWYKAAKVKGDATWSDVYLDFDTLLPTITANTPVYKSPEGQFVGVCATDIILSRELNEFLRSLRISKSGIAFIVEPSGLLLASSTKEPITSGSDENTKLLPAGESENPLIQGVIQYLSNTYESLERVESSQHNFLIEGERQYLQIVRFNDRHGIDWIVVLLVPENDFMERINHNTQITFFLCLIALIVTILIGLMITQWLTKPLQQLSATAKGIANGDWHEVTEIERSDAIGDLSRSFVTMTQQLKSSFKTLEKRIEERTLEIIQLNQELRGLANIDGLTQTANRRYFDHFLEKEWQRHLRDQQPLTLILCDVDYFKQYNDAYGHVAGDRCLQQIAQILIRAVQRPADLVARYGGEEFTIILSKTDVDGGMHVAENINKMLRKMQIPHSNYEKQYVTISMGIASVVPSFQITSQALILMADQALYAAKSKGRDCYCIAADSVRIESAEIGE
ncbi:MAG: diguanylate cyclase [Cyanobacteria bacterium P01_F01_bin.86]